MDHEECAPGGSAGSIRVELLTLDVRGCEPCTEAERSLDQALSQLQHALQKSGKSVSFTKRLVSSADQAEELHLYLSPTIQVNGKQLTFGTTTPCGACSEVSGVPVSCRTQIRGDSPYETPLSVLIADEIMRAVDEDGNLHDSGDDRSYSMPENLLRFFAGQSTVTNNCRA